MGFLRHVKATGAIPSSHLSHTQTLEQREIPLSDEYKRKWVSEFSSFRGETMWIILDGFLLYWHPVSDPMSTNYSCYLQSFQDVLQQIDVRFFLRVPRDVLEQRRYERDYYTAGEGSDMPVFMLLTLNSLLSVYSLRLFSFDWSPIRSRGQLVA